MSMREFETGATRNDDREQLDYEAFFSPVVLRAVAEYMHRHRIQADGTYRPGDNWQKGIPIPSYRSSLIRHTMDAWLEGRGFDSRAGLMDALCGIIFNASGWMFEILTEDEPVPAHEPGSVFKVEP